MSMEASCGMLSSSGGSSSPASCTSHTGAVGGLYFGQRHPDHLAFPVDAVTQATRNTIRSWSLISREWRTIDSGIFTEGGVQQ